MDTKRLREILDNLVSDCQDMDKHIDFVNLTIDQAIKEIQELSTPRLMDWEKVLPASNRKSCKIEEHYMSRYKQGWNDYRKEALSALKSISEPRLMEEELETARDGNTFQKKRYYALKKLYDEVSVKFVDAEDKIREHEKYGRTLKAEIEKLKSSLMEECPAYGSKMKFNADFKKESDEFWKEIIYQDGKIDEEQVLKELADHYFMLEEIPKVYCHATGGLLSKQMYYATSINPVISDYITKSIEEEIQQSIEDGLLEPTEEGLKYYDPPQGTGKKPSVREE